jgi:diketogulonate reductase-like aldo/keto reductase
MQKDGVIPIPGTTKFPNLLANIDANKVKLTEDELKILNNLGEAKGYRYTEASMRAYGLEDELVSG